MSTLMSSCPAPLPRVGLLDLPVELADHIINHLVREFPVAYLVAFSLACRAARQLCSRRLHNLDWTVSRRGWTGGNFDYNCRLLLRLLARDLASSHVYCGKCLKLHPFYDAPTELSPQFRLPEDRYAGCLHDCEILDTRKCWLFDTNFPISRRQIYLIRHYYLHGHGIPAHLLTKEIDVAPGAGGVVPAAPHWRRRIWFYPRKTKNSTTVVLAVRHEFVAPHGGADARRRARRYLDSTPYWVCPHLRTHAVDGESSNRNNNDVDHSSVGCGLREPVVSSLWGGLHHHHTGTRGNRYRPGDDRHDPLRRGGRRFPGLDMYGTAAAGPLVPVSGGGERLGVWIHCLLCRTGTCWEVESDLSALVGDGDEGLAGGGGRDDAQGGEGVVCFSLTTETVVY